MLVFAGEGKPEEPEKNSWERGRQPRTDSTHMGRAPLPGIESKHSGGTCSHQCVIHVPQSPRLPVSCCCFGQKLKNQACMAFQASSNCLKKQTGLCSLNLLTLKSDQHLISPYNITLESNIKVVRIKEIIAN